MPFSNIGHRVCYKPPRSVKGGHRRTGKIVDEVWVDADLHDSAMHPADCKGKDGELGLCWGDYAFCAQLIAWDNGWRSIRLAYYRRICGQKKWLYASQMTVDSFPPTIKTLLEKTLAKGHWFN